jgi:hypothetical protein
LKFLTRCTVNACISASDTDSKFSDSDDADDLGIGLSRLTLDGSAPTLPKGGLKVISSGRLVPQSSLIEIKTRSVTSARSIDWVDIFPQLYLSQTPHLYLAIHRGGEFSTIKKMELETIEISGVASDALMRLRGLVKVLKDIRRLSEARGEEGRRFTLVCIADELSVHFGGKDLLPPDLLELFN